MGEPRLVHLRRALRQLLCVGLDLLAPGRCAACGQDAGPGLCPPCRTHLRVRSEPACPRCGESLVAVGDRCQSDHRHLRGLAFARAPFGYAGTGGALVRRFKFARDGGAGLWLCRAMARSAMPLLQGPFRRALVVPVPLHRSRRRARGHDQAAWLAQALARRLGLDCGQGTLVRTRATLPQGDPRVTSRDRNVAGAFAVARVRSIGARAVLLVDDVLTSGSTARACGAVLREAGSGPVAVLTACRA